MGMSITTKAFKASEMIPSKYTCDGPDVSPDLQWSGAPANTKGFALICDDPDAPAGTWVHWGLYGLSHDASGLPEAMPKDAESGYPKCKTGKNDFGKVGYGGPCPPRGPAHRYFFQLYALDADLNLNAKATKADLLKTMEGHIVGQAELVG